MTDYLIKEDVFMALTGDITDCTIEEFIARLRDKLSKLPSVNVVTNYDCISRQAVLEGIAEWVADGYADSEADISHISSLVTHLPPVTPKEKTGWIPVSERLPEIHQDILLSFRSLDVKVGFRAEEKPYFYCNGAYIKPQDVLAWMPLPEPYKAESEG